jgi:hypothetical protein
MYLGCQLNQDRIPANQILLTERGSTWLGSFEERDRGIARDLGSSLTLVSHTEFERNLAKLIVEVASSVEGLVALYGAREIPGNMLVFDATSRSDESFPTVMDATPRGSDIGSEGRIASIIRNLCIEKKNKLLNHPSKKQLLDRRVEAILIIDDFVGSGQRCRRYLKYFWTSPTVRSWHSYKRIKFMIAAYSATVAGSKYVNSHPSRPEVHLSRHCPTLESLHWRSSRIEAAKKLCRDYAKKFELGSMHYGFGRTGALLVFEHGCPNNVPAIFWARSKSNAQWTPLFPEKRVAIEVTSAFPREIVAREPVHVMVEAGQRKLAEKIAAVDKIPVTKQESLVLAFFAQGKRRVETVASATGLAANEAERLIEQCIDKGWISPRRRITDLGHAELKGIQGSQTKLREALPSLGSDVYYPVALRNHDNG